MRSMRWSHPQLMTTSMRLAENRRERQREQLVVEIVADMHGPVTPVFRALFHDQRSHHAGRLVTRLGEVAHRGAGLIDANLAGTGAVEIDLSHVRPHSRANRRSIGSSRGFRGKLRTIPQGELRAASAT